MPLLRGERLGPYEILAPLGAGGMGEVYSARDTRLGRTVAIKITQERFTDRFEREARTISALNHPNICQLYDVGPNYLVMELVDGAPVAPVDTPRKLLDLAVQIADGLSAAHAAGIIHRDLKPDNVFVTRDGRVKILDFGLAAVRSTLAGSEDATATVTGTAPGMILGTVAYMSPEQARGEANLTAQSDQFAMGLLLYELSAGRRAFQRSSPAETLATIIREEPDPLPTTTPARLRWVIERLLAKDPAERYDSTRDLYRELRHIRDQMSQATSASVVTAPDSAHARLRVRSVATLAAAVLAGVVLGGAAIAIWMASRPTLGPSEADLSEFSFTPIANDQVREIHPSWAPDGKSIAYLASVNGVYQIFTRSIGSSEAAQITRSETGILNPSWSPDGATIYFTSAGALWAVGSAGGVPDRVFERVGSYALHPDGRTILFSRGRTLWVGARGEEPREFTLPDEIASLPGGRGLLGFSPDGSKLACFCGEHVWIVPYPAGPPQRVFDSNIQAASWMPDSRRLVLTRVVSEAHTLSMLDTITGDHRVFYKSPEPLFSAVVSRDGTRVAYATGRVQWNIVEVGTSDGRVRTLQASGGLPIHPSWAPSGTRYLFARDRGGRSGIEEASAAERYSRRVVEVEKGTVAFPRWAPNESQFTFLWISGPRNQLMLSNTSGRMAPLDPDAPGPTGNATWSPDGRHVIYTRRIEDQRTEVARIRPGSTAAREILASYPIDEPTRLRAPMEWSPRGDLILAESEGSNRQLFLVTPDFTSERPLSFERLGVGPMGQMPMGQRGFGAGPMGFSRDGREVLGMHRSTSGDGAEWQLWSVDIATGRERLLSNVDLPVGADALRGFSLHPDGTRFLTAVSVFPYDIWMLEGFERR